MITWKTLSYPEIKSKLIELFGHKDMSFLDMVSALYWAYIEAIGNEQDDNIRWIIRKGETKMQHIFNCDIFKPNYNNMYHSNNKKYIPYRSDRNYDDFDFDSLYAN